jgi:DNA-binding transcriptional regulator LsrR (DeoR family)
LENALREQFELAQVQVAAFRPGVDAQAAVGDLGAQWLDESLRDGQVLGLSWGTTLQAVVDSFSVDQPRSVELVPLIGGLSTVVSLVSGEELVRELAGKLGATYRYLHAPGVLRSTMARNSLLAEPAIAEVLQRAQKADIAMVGIGAAGIGSSSAVIDALGLTSAERKAFMDAGPVGDTCCRFFDAEGRPILGPVHDRVLAIELDQLRRIPTVMGVATGTEKALGVLGAIRGGLVDGLIIDASLALALLSKPRKN